ncbi:hypothetical protein [Flavobacterium sp. LB1P62]|uniref:hypothetical protein n=1 Tax=Flavobacterium sp. LB1P62 TaxID=3401715 RepID=UPI003AAF7647
MLFFVVIISYFSYLRKIIKIYNDATEGLVQHLLQLIWAIGLMGKWFCIWDDLANPNNGLNLTPNQKSLTRQ